LVTIEQDLALQQHPLNIALKLQSLEAELARVCASCLQYDVADCRDMPQYGDGAFAAVVDKGTLDALLCGEGAETDAPAMVSNCHR
jgi:hypothetical protein